MEPEKVTVKNPIFGFSEKEILNQLFGKKGDKYLDRVEKADKDFYQKRIELDKKMYQKAKSSGYDAIVLMTEAGKKSLQKGRKPNSIELNLFNDLNNQR